MASHLKISSEQLKQIFDEAIRCHPEESCGFLLGTIAKEREAIEFVACKNRQNEMHDKDPDRYPRTAEMAYIIDSKEQDAIFARAKQKKLEVIAIVHSHPEHGAYFSDEDKNNAAPWGEPLFPNISYVVVSVYGKKIKAMSDFYWDDEAKDYLEEKFNI